MDRYLIECIGELQEVYDIAALSQEHINRGIIPAQIPPGCAIWSGSEIVADLPQIKARLHNLVKAKRDSVEIGGIISPYGPVETDPISQRKINGATLMAMILGNDFTIDWRMADNSVVTLNSAQMIEIGLLAGQHISAAQDRKNQLDAQIDACVSLVELNAIDIGADW